MSNRFEQFGEDATREGDEARGSPRKLASGLNNIASVVGTGPGGRITVADVERLQSQLTETVHSRVADCAILYRGSHSKTTFTYQKDHCKNDSKRTEYTSCHLSQSRKCGQVQRVKASSL